MLTRNSPRSILFISRGAESPSTRYRAAAFYGRLLRAGWEPRHLTAGAGPLRRLSLLREARRASVVVVLRKTFSGPFRRLLRLAARRLVLDIDDAVFTRSSGEPSRSRRGRFERMARLCDQIWVGNRYLAQEAGRLNPSVRLLPTSLDPARYEMAAARPEETLDLVWIGGASTRRYLAQALPVLEQAAVRVPRLRLKVVADFALDSTLLRTVAVPWSEAGEAQELVTAHVGIAPMPDDPWTRGKCGLKVLQYMAAGLPVVASAAGVHRELVGHGESGFLASSEDEWIGALARLAADPDLRSRMGAEGRRRLHEGFTTERAFAAMRSALEDL